MKKNQSLLTLGLLVLSVLAPLGAQENPAPSAELNASGYVKANALWAPGVASPASQLSQAGLTSSFRLELDIGDYGLLVANTEAFINLGNLGLTSTGISNARSLYPLAWRYSIEGQFNADLDIKELYYENSLGDFDLRLGKQIFAWGLADGNNPTDILNARHVGTRSGASGEENKMGALALDLVWNLSDGKSKIEAVFLPYSVVNDLPTIPSSVSGSGIIGDPLVTVRFADQRPDWNVANFEGAIRGLFYFDNFSFSISYLTLLDRFPDLATPITVTTPGFGPPTAIDISNTLVYNRIHAFGLDWATNIAGFDFRGEALLSLTKDNDGSDYLVKNSNINGTVQVSRSWLDGNLITSLSWAPRIVLGYKAYDSYSPSIQNAAKEAYKQNGQGFAFENGIGLRVETKLVPEVFSTTIFGLVNLAAQDYLAQLSLDWVIADGWKLRGGGTLYGTFRSSTDPLREFGTFGNSTTDLKDSLFLELVFSY